MRRWGETVIIMLICFLLAVWMAQPLFESTTQSLLIQKKTELYELRKTLQLYYLETNSFPGTRGNGGFCEIDTQYPGRGICLSELVRDGYYHALPISPDDAPYWYFRFGDFAAVGSDLPIDTEENTCNLPNGFEFWCVKIYK